MSLFFCSCAFVVVSFKLDELTHFGCETFMQDFLKCTSVELIGCSK